MANDWNEEDDKEKTTIDRNFVACSEGYEKNEVVHTFKEEWPRKTEAELKKAFQQACTALNKEGKKNHPRKDFIAKMESILSGK